MAWNRIHAARLLRGEERALFEASLPEHASQMSERELRSSLERLRRKREQLAASAGDGRHAQMLDEALHRLEKVVREPAGDRRRAAPRAGRTGGLGTRAERPSEGGIHRSVVKPPSEPGRGGKAPSATGEEREAQARNERP